MAHLWGDIRFAFRQLYRAKVFTLTAVVTLSLGIAAATGIFSLVNAVLLKKLAFPDPDQLVSLDTLSKPHGSNGPALTSAGTSYPNFFDWRSQAKSFQSMFSFGTAGLTVPANGETQAQRVTGTVVSAGFFHTLKASPILGRDFTAEDEKPGTGAVILSYRLWQQRYAGSRDVIGRTMSISEEPYTITGVAPPGFYFPVNAPDTAVYVIFSKVAEGNGRENRGWNQLSVLGRLRDGTTMASAKAEMDTIQRGLAAQYEDDANETAVSVKPLLEDTVGEYQKPLNILLGAVSCLLLIACANVAGLLLTRAHARRSEFAMRAALGASRMQMLRQMLLESLFLSLGSGLLAVFLTWDVLQATRHLLPEIPRVDEVGLDVPVFLFALGVSVLTGLLFGFGPAWRTSKLDPAEVLHDNARSITANRGQNRLHAGLVIAETAASLILLIGAGLLMRSFNETMRVHPGFRPEHMFTFRVFMPEKRYPEQKRAEFYHQVFDQLRTVPGVQAVSGAFPMPLVNGEITISFTVEGHPNRPGDTPSERLTIADPQYFETLGIPLLHGRTFKAVDEATGASPVVIVNKAFAQKYFQSENVVGKYMTPDVGPGGRNQHPRRQIVGVVGNVKRLKLTEEDRPEYYLVDSQAPIAPLTVAVRVQGDPGRYENTVRQVVRAADSALPVSQFRPYQETLTETVAQERFRLYLIGGFAGLALLLSAVGLYGLLSYMVRQRQSELGLRMALGAQPGDVLRLILRRGLALTVAGLACGLVLAGVSSRFLSGLLFGIEPVDLVTYALMAIVLLAVAFTASFAPAWRASKLDPIETLREL